jgi:hypothetical protein
MKWHTITLRYPTDLTDDQENILVSNWREVRRLTAESLLKQSKKVDSLVKGLKTVRLKDSAMTTEQLGNQLANRAAFIQGEFRFDKRSGREYVLMISELALPDDGKIQFDIFGRRLTVTDTLKHVAHTFWNGVSKDMGIDRKDVQYEVGVVEL